MRLSGKTRNLVADTMRVNCWIGVVGKYNANMELFSGTAILIDALFIGTP